MRRCEHRRHNPRREAETIDLRHALAWLLLLAAAVFASSPGNRHADVRQVDVPEARALIDAGALVIDVRDRAASGPEAAHILTQAGFVQTVNLRPGIEGWRRAGLPTSSG